MATDANLGDRIEEFVSRLVRTGRYDSRDDVLREGVLLIEERERRLSAVNAAIERGLSDADAGRVKSIHDVGARLLAKYRAMTEDDRQ